jgi:hypothetical protein
MIREHDKVVLTVALSDHGLEPGDVGVVVHIYPRQEAYEIEFVTLSGQTAAIVTASANQIRHIGQHEIPHARELAHRWTSLAKRITVARRRKQQEPNRTTGRGNRGRPRGRESPEGSSTSQRGRTCRQFLDPFRIPLPPPNLYISFSDRMLYLTFRND